MGQKKTWSFHHVPFTMLWESMSLTYKNNWQSVLAAKMLDCYSESIFDKEYTSSNFIFTWKSFYFRAKLLRVLSKPQRLDTHHIKTTKNNKVSFKFQWIENANKGTNESTCTKSYLIKQSNDLIVLNFFFRENFNLVKLRKKNNPFANVEDELADLKDKLKQAIQKHSKQKFSWVFNRKFRKINKKQLQFLNKFKTCYASCFPGDFQNFFKFSLNSKKINNFYFFRLKHIKNYLTKVRFNIFSNATHTLQKKKLIKNNLCTFL